MRRAESLLTTLLVALVPATVAAQGGTIRGRVADAAGAPLARALVSAEGAGVRASSDEQGRYELHGVPAGAYTLRVRLLGYVPQTARVTVGPGATVQHDFALAAQPISLSPVDVVVGSRARHTAAEELAVPVDVFPAEVLAQQGTNETSQILQAVAPSVNFPHQSVTDATDIVRPFTLRGLSPDHTLVLVNGWRRHQTAVVNTFAYGTGAGSSGVDMNAIPASAIDRIEVLRDGASAQYGSDAIAGVVNVVLKESGFTPFLNASAGRYTPRDYADDGTTVDVSGGWGIGVGRGSLALFGTFLDRQPTNRAWADPYEDAGTGLTDSVNSEGRVVIKRNPVPQPNHHWGDGLEKDVLTMANFRLPLNPGGTAELYSFGGYSFRRGTGQGYRRYASSERNWPEIYPLGFLPEFAPDVADYSAAGGFRGVTRGWSLDLGASFGHNDFTYNLRNTLNTSLGPCLDPANPCAPGDDGILGNGDDPGIPNQTSFFAGRLRREELAAGVNAAKSVRLGLPAPVSVALGLAFRREAYRITRGELASYVDGGDTTQAGTDATGGSQVFPGFAPTDEADAHRTNVGAYVDLETNFTPRFLANAAGRFERYSDFGSLFTGKAALRYQPSPRLTLRAAGSTGFRAPGLGQINFSKVVTNVIAGTPVQVGIFPVADSAARLLGAKPLKEETSVNLSGGFAFSPSDAFTLTADVFRITINDRILLGATFDDSVTLAILAANGFTNVGGIQYFTNGLDTRTQGVDVTADWRAAAGTGVLQLTGAVNFTKNEITRVDPLPAALDTAGSTEPGIIDSVTYIGITEERPDWRATFTGQYSVGRLHALARASYYGKFSSAQPGFCDNCRDNYGAKTLFDAEVGYHFSQVDLAVGVRNLFDTYPDQPTSLTPVDPPSDLTPAKDYNNNFGVFPWAAASPFGYNGRYVYARVEMRLQ
ncbi:MAG TPA: TonB-dependent receptor [Gemmatimonadales bacterium]|nr:TonB-dependent receptor [Gemmatimonadales bacterium]